MTTETKAALPPEPLVFLVPVLEPEQDQAALWAAEQSHEDYMAFVMEGGLKAQEKRRC